MADFSLFIIYYKTQGVFYIFKRIQGVNFYAFFSKIVLNISNNKNNNNKKKYIRFFNVCVYSWKYFKMNWKKI